MKPARILILYYSLTHQTRTALEIMAEELTRKQHVVDMVRLTPVKEYKFPWGVTRFLALCFRTYLGMRLWVDLKPLPADKRISDYDFVIIGYQPWFLTVSTPVLSFLDSPMSEALRDKKVISVITCRSLWKRSYGIFEAKVNARGGTVVESCVIEDQSEPPANMVSTVFYLLTGIDIGRQWFLKRYFRPFGIGEQGLTHAKSLGQDLSAKLERGEL